jgi:shikimate kinase
MASGKTTVGRALADRLGWELVDLDGVIRDETGREPGEILRTDGESVFRALEAKLTDRYADRDHLILAPGGGWAAQPGLIRRLGPGTTRVWLRISVDEALRRAAAAGVDRPLLGPAEGRRERATELLRRREPHYAEAELVVDVDGRESEAVADEILRRLGMQREDDER